MKLNLNLNFSFGNLENSTETKTNQINIKFKSLQAKQFRTSSLSQSGKREEEEINFGYAA